MNKYKDTKNSRKLKFTQEMRNSSRPLTKSREWSENQNPTPLHFDRFIPWLCHQMHVSTLVTVERIIKTDNTFAKSRRGSSTRSRSIESIIQSEYFDFTGARDCAFSTSSLPSCSGVKNNAINIKSFYNNRNQLVEVAIIDSPIRINRKVIQAINLCLPFHELFKKFVIKGQGLTESVLYEIGKLLPHSNITNVCLDDTYVPEGNYYVLLEKINKLETLSLCRCKINDEVCKTIADHLHVESPASKSLLTLDLTSNRISNLGASYIGMMLRTNRSLVCLNLSDNIIGDTGASHILRSLMLFSLTENERYLLRKRRFKYSAEKLEQYIKCEKQVIDRIKSEENKENSLKNDNLSLNPIKGKIMPRISKPGHVLAVNELSVKVQAEKMTREIVGEFIDSFDDSNITLKNGKLNCIGNLKLCYLNLAYNDIKYFSLKKLCEVLKYQSSLKDPHLKGLLKVVIEGNNIPVESELLQNIDLYLGKAVKKCMRLKDLHRSPSSLGRKMHRKLLHSTS